MSTNTLILIILLIVLIGVLPSWPHSQSWGPYPAGIIGVILIVLLILFLMGRL